MLELEEFHCIQRCPHFRELEYRVPLPTEVSSFQGVGIEEFPLYIEVYSFQERSSTVYRDVLISGCWNIGFHCIQRCPHFRGLE